MAFVCVFSVCFDVDHYWSLLLNLLQWCFCFMICFFGDGACGILTPWPRCVRFKQPPALEAEVSPAELRGEPRTLSLINTSVMSPSRLHQASFPSYGNRVEECFSNLSLTPKSFGYLVEPEGKSPMRHIQQGRLLLCPRPPRCATLGSSIPQSLCEWALCSCPLCNWHGLYAVKTWLHLFYIWRPLF